MVGHWITNQSNEKIEQFLLEEWIKLNQKFNRKLGFCNNQENKLSTVSEIHRIIPTYMQKL